jgi:hypothetical protein
MKTAERNVTAILETIDNTVAVMTRIDARSAFRVLSEMAMNLRGYSPKNHGVNPFGKFQLD